MPREKVAYGENEYFNQPGVYYLLVKSAKSCYIRESTGRKKGSSGISRTTIGKRKMISGTGASPLEEVLWVCPPIYGIIGLSR